MQRLLVPYGAFERPDDRRAVLAAADEAQAGVRELQTVHLVEMRLNLENFLRIAFGYHVVHTNVVVRTAHRQKRAARTEREAEQMGALLDALHSLVRHRIELLLGVLVLPEADRTVVRGGHQQASVGLRVRTEAERGNHAGVAG